MLTSIEVESPGARDILQLPIEESEDPLQRNNYHVLGVDGLDPVKASFASTDLANADGVYIQSSRLDVRNLVLTLGMNPDYADNSVQELRTRLYRYFMPKSEIKIRCIDSDYVAKTISGYVESMETPIFVKEPRVSVSILCPNPDFSSVEDSVETLQTTANSDRFSLDYSGSAPTGFIFRCNTGTDYLNAFRIEVQSEQGNIQTFSYNDSTQPGMAVEVDTRMGYRKVMVYDNGPGMPRLYNVAIGSVWPQLHPGSNLIRVYSIGNPINYTLTYNAQFGGL